ncbi:MAG: PASTA domain-containing protein [Gemmatimonadota bacterium]
MKFRRHEGPPFLQTMGGRRFIRGAVIVLIAMIAGYLVSAFWLFPAPLFSRDQRVPRLLDEGLTLAQEDLVKAGFRVKLAGEEPDPRVPKDKVVWQDPPPGTILVQGSTVTLTPSGGPAQILVPDVVTFDAAEARKVMLAAGLSIGSEDSVQSSVDPGVVVQTRPAAGAARDAGSAVTLVLSSGSPPTGVPSVIGMSLEDARRVVERLGLTIGNLKVDTRPGPPGVVVEQAPAAGSRLMRGSRVDLVVSGKEDS